MVLGGSLGPDSVRALETLVNWGEKLSTRMTSSDLNFETVGHLWGSPTGTKFEIPNTSHFSQNVDLHVPYSRVRPTFTTVMDSTKRYDHPDVTIEQYGVVRHRRNITFMKKVFAHLKGQLKPKHIDDIEYNTKSSVGPLLEFENKGDCITKCSDLVHWYSNWAHIFGIVPLWKTSGKKEIRPELKVAAKAIRTFTYTDPFYTMAFAREISSIKEWFILMGNCFSGLSPFRPGVTFAHGGFDGLMSSLEGLDIVEGDVRLWDSTFTSVLDTSVEEMYLFFAYGDHPTDFQKERMRFFCHQRFESRVLLPNGQVVVLPFMPSGSSDTTVGNCLGHFYILCDHLLDSCEQEKVDPFVTYLQCRWNLFSDDHLNGYPKWMKPYLAYELRLAAYARVGGALKPPPDDKVHSTPLGSRFLGAVAHRKHGCYYPIFDTQRLLAILYCNEYNDEELQMVLISIAPLIVGNVEACRIYSDYLQRFYPLLLGLLIDRDILSGAE